MLAPTHGVFGVFLTLIILAVFGIQSSLHWTVLLCAIVGSLAPDLDSGRSLIGKLFPFISTPLERKFGHRTATHSLIGWTIANLCFAILLAILFFLYYQAIPFIRFHSASLFSHHSVTAIYNKALPWSLSYFRMVAAFAFGYISHLILDMFNPRGVQLLWPDPTRDVIPKNVDLRPESGAKSEIFIFIILVFLLCLSLPLSRYGLMTSLRWFLATPEAAISEFKTTHEKTYVTFEGIYQATRTPVSGQAEILDVQNKKMIVYFEGSVFTLSDELSADILAKKVHLIKTDTPLRTATVTFTNQTRENLLAKLSQNALVSGVIILPKDMHVKIPDLPLSKFKTMTQVENELRLSFASQRDLKRVSWDDAFLLMQRQDALRFKKLNREIAKTTNELNTLDDTKGLTPLGQELLLTNEDRQTAKKKRETLSIQLDDLEFEKEELALKMKTHDLLFSGKVTILK